MVANLLCFNKLGEMLSTPSFWYTIILIIGAIMVLIACFKYPKIGKWILLVLFYVVLICVTIYSLIQLNIYYKARGGVIGQISTIFKPNEVKVVDDITYKFNNTELLQVGDSDTYRADVSLDEVLELTKGVKYQLLINDVPCGYSDNNEDYILANYNYIFYNDDMTAAFQDILKIRIAFYKNFTNFTISTDGGATAVKYWNYYFNKNDFVIKLGTKASVDNDKDYSNGDVSNFATVRYFVNEGLDKTEIVYKGSKITYVPNIEKFEFWSLNGTRIGDDFVVTGNIDLIANTVPMYTCNFQVLNDVKTTQDVYKNSFAQDYTPDEFIENNRKYQFLYWTVDNVRVDLSTYPITQNTTFVACLDVYDYLTLNIYKNEIGNLYTTISYWIKTGSKISLDDYVHSNYVITKASIDNVQCRILNYSVTEPVTIDIEGYFKFVLTFKSDDQVYTTVEVKEGETGSLPANPTSENKTFIGWSLDGTNVVEDISAELSNIDRDKTFYAVFSDQLFTLQILNAGNGDVITEVAQISGSTYELTPPAAISEGVTFVGWKCSKGSINGNTYTFTSQNDTVYAVWDKACLKIDSEAYSGGSVIWMTVIDNPSITYTYNGETKTEDYVSIMVTTSGSIVVKTSCLNTTLKSVQTDGTYTVSGNAQDGLIITWQNATYLSIVVTGNNLNYT